ncbi:MAG: bifunctional diguanylate cyclase/phosphodiesterase [Actinobacteria bacterium]|nr:bifunctional diguanylate cyclase/phosphodiesterase [Actinomycetota bacterium]
MIDGGVGADTAPTRLGIPRWVLGVAVAALIFFILYAVSLPLVERPGGSPALVWDIGVYTIWMLLGVVIVSWRAGQSDMLRRGWQFMAAYLVLTLAAELAFRFVSDVPSQRGLLVADVLFLSAYLCIGAGLIILSRRGHSVSPVARIDGLIVGLTVAAVIFAVYLPNSSHDGRISLTAIDLIYPILDVMFATIVIAGLVPLRFRPTPAIAAILVAVIVMAVGDFVYAEQIAGGQFEQGTPLEISWASGSAMIIAAALLPNPYNFQPGIERRWTIFTPSVASLAALALITVSLFVDTPEIVVALALAALTLASLRLVLTMIDLRRAGQGYEQARRDYLTGLLNMRGMSELIDSWFGTRHPGEVSLDRPGGLVRIGVTGVKTVVDTLGHEVGDDLLRAIGARLSSATGPFTLARLDGSDFAVLVPNGDKVDQVAEEVANALDSPLQLDELSIRVGVNVGIARIGHGVSSRDSLLRSADVALTEAAKSGQLIVEFDPEHDPTEGRRVDLMADLHGGIERGELFMAYQPLVRVRDGWVLGAEALVRWQHPTLGQLQPDEFVRAAERAGLIGRVTRHSLAESCGALREWLDAGLDLTMSVNISGIDLVDESLPNTVAQVLRETGIDAERLVMEITETAIGADPERIRRTVNELRALGVRVAIDDFGVGYSSLAQLMNMPVDEVKVDRGFLAASDPDARQTSLAAAVRLASALGAEVVVEGVEAASDLELLRRVGCDLAQGFYFSPPLTADDFAECVRTHRWR